MAAAQATTNKGNQDSMNFTRKIAAASATVGISAAGLLGVAMPAAHASVAKAAATGTVCTSVTSTATISPGLTFSPGKDTETATLSASGCNPVGSPPATSLTGNISLKSTNLTCDTGTAKGTFTSTANNGQTSSGTIALKADGANSPLQFTITGKVTKGLLAGSKIKGAFTATPVNGDCATTPLTKATIANNGNVTL